MNSFKVMTVDLSFRDTGVCQIRHFPEADTIELATNIESPEFGNGFDDLSVASYHMHKTVDHLIFLQRGFNPDITIVEMPCFTQSAKSALAIGVCWGAIRRMDCVLIEPSALKRWSDSKPGDGKSAVKLEVARRAHLLPKQLSNDNIVDAVGIALFFTDLISQLKHETKTTQR